MAGARQDPRIVIVGAGPTGLGAGYRLQELGYDDWVILEANDYVGGLATSFTDEGFTYDIGGHVMFSHYPYYDDLVDKLMGGDFTELQREAWVWMEGRFIPYPFQNNIRHLDPQTVFDCVNGLIRAQREGRSYDNFRAWVDAVFGAGIAEHFMIPYNFKVWATPAAALPRHLVARPLRRVAVRDRQHGPLGHAGGGVRERGGGGRAGDGVDPARRGRGGRGDPVNVLVVGGAGYVGSVVSRHLLDAGHRVTVGDDLSRGHRWAVPEGAELRVVDILDPAGAAALVGGEIDAVMHFAALSLVAESVERPVKYFRANVLGTLNLLDAMRAHGVRRLVFSSTAAVYGEPETVPIAETAATRPTNPYGASKLAVDHVIGYEAAASRLGAVSLRYFNVAGASGAQGELHHPETHLIPSVLRVALGEQPSVAIFGTDYPTPDGTAVRDYIHVDDLAHAHLLALDATEQTGHGVYNLGNGAGFSVREVIDTARLVTGCQIPAVEAPRRPGDPPVLVASSERIRADLGWVPEKPGLDTMVSDAWHWMRSRRPTTTGAA